MKYKTLILFVAAAFVGCTKPLTLVVSNPSILERNGSMAEISVSELTADAADIQNYALFDDQHRKVPYQVMYYGQEEPQSIIWQVDNIRGGMLRNYTWKKAKPAVAKPKVSAQFVPERKDDFAWENDLAAYRMYGPALAPENPSNGVDLWLKCTDELIVSKFYDDDLHHGKPYHINHGKGLDCYKVAHTLGCGGIAPYVDGELLVGDHFTDWEILEEGPLRVIFRLTYPTHTLTVTCDAGAQLNKATIKYQISNINCLWAAGIYLHDKIDNISYSEQGGWAAYAEDAVSDAGEPQGRNYCAVCMPDAKEIKLEDGHLLVIGETNCEVNRLTGESANCSSPVYQFNSSPKDNTKHSTLNYQLTYYFGGGWSQWKYPTDADWFTATAETAHNITLPLKVTVDK